MEDAQVGTNLRRLRESLGLSQADVAEAATSAGWSGVYPQTILKVEKGLRALKFSEAVAISQALGFRVDLLVDPDGKQGSDWTRLARLSRAVRKAEADLNQHRIRAEEAQAALNNARQAFDVALAEFKGKYPDQTATLTADSVALLDEAGRLARPDYLG